MVERNASSNTTRERAAKKLVAFAALIHARVTNDEREADQRTRELASMGVQVEFSKPDISGAAQNCAAEVDRG